jgi:hypothetical protein
MLVVTPGLLSWRDFMSDEKVLTKEIAEQFLGDNDSLDLSEFTAIEDAAADSLSKYEGDFVNLDNLPASAAKILRDAGHGY